MFASELYQDEGSNKRKDSADDLDPETKDVAAAPTPLIKKSKTPNSGDGSAPDHDFDDSYDAAPPGGLPASQDAASASAFEEDAELADVEVASSVAESRTTAASKHKGKQKGTKLVPPPDTCCQICRGDLGLDPSEYGNAGSRTHQCWRHKQCNAAERRVANAILATIGGGPLHCDTQPQPAAR